VRLALRRGRRRRRRGVRRGRGRMGVGVLVGRSGIRGCLRCCGVGFGNGEDHGKGKGRRRFIPGRRSWVFVIEVMYTNSLTFFDISGLRQLGSNDNIPATKYTEYRIE
jgi:hypothetical protein